MPTLSVDDPASDPAIAAAGGTTLPGLQQFCLNANCTALYQINIPNERVWGWDYLDGLVRRSVYLIPSLAVSFPQEAGEASAFSLRDLITSNRFRGSATASTGGVT